MHKNKSLPTLFLVADTTLSPILGYKTSKKLDLIQRIYEIDSTPLYIEEFEDCFGELGTLPQLYHIVTDPSVPPVIDACRKVPIQLQDKLQKELERMENLGIKLLLLNQSIGLVLLLLLRNRTDLYVFV